MAAFGISAGQCVAVVWDKSASVEALKELVDQLQGLTGDAGQVSVENINQLLQCKFSHMVLRGLGAWEVLPFWWYCVWGHTWRSSQLTSGSVFKDRSWWVRKTICDAKD